MGRIYKNGENFQKSRKIEGGKGKNVENYF